MHNLLLDSYKSIYLRYQRFNKGGIDPLPGMGDTALDRPGSTPADPETTRPF